MRVVGAMLLAIGIAVGTVAALWTAWRALGAEVDYCPDGDCITAYWITLPTLLVAVGFASVGVALLRRHR